MYNFQGVTSTMNPQNPSNVLARQDGLDQIQFHSNPFEWKRRRPWKVTQKGFAIWATLKEPGWLGYIGDDTTQ